MVSVCTTAEQKAAQVLWAPPSLSSWKPPVHLREGPSPRRSASLAALPVNCWLKRGCNGTCALRGGVGGGGCVITAGGESRQPGRSRPAQWLILR